MRSWRREKLTAAPRPIFPGRAWEVLPALNPFVLVIQRHGCGQTRATSFLVAAKGPARCRGIPSNGGKSKAYQLNANPLLLLPTEQLCRALSHCRVRVGWLCSVSWKGYVGHAFISRTGELLRMQRRLFSVLKVSLN